MKIKLAILEKDNVYLQRISAAFHNKYADKLEVYSFTEQDTALKTAAEAKINVLLAGEEYSIESENLPERCAFAWFVDTPDVEHINQSAAICKYQKIDIIYKQIVSLYSEIAGDIVTTVGGEEGKTSIICVLSPAGGVGASTVAAACAISSCRQGKRTLYLSLEKYGTVGSFFQGDGLGGLGDVLYAIKSQKSNLALKLEGLVRQDKSGVHFLPECNIVLDRMEMKAEELDILLRQIKLSETYDNVVLDADFSFDSFEMEVMKQAGRILFVSDGSRNANAKIRRVCEAMKILEQQGKCSALNKAMLIYNRFRSQTGKTMDDLQLPVLGGIQCFKGAGEAQIAAEIARMSVVEKLMQ